MRKHERKPLTKPKLLRAVQGTYEDTQFLVGAVVDENADFLKGLVRNRSYHIGKKELLREIERSPFIEFPYIPGGHDLILISSRLYVWRDSINHSQTFPETLDVEDFEHCCDRANAHFDVFYRFEHEAGKITFALGDQRRELPIREYSGWAWNLGSTELLCNTISDLERNFRDKDWNPIAVHIGRKALKIKDIV